MSGQRRLSPIQTKLTVGQPGDAYEQEADRVAAQVVSQINAPQPSQQVQREELPEEELQMKPIAGIIQREELPEEELQMKPMLQRQLVTGEGKKEAPQELSHKLGLAYISAKPGPGRTVAYADSEENQLIKTGGSLAWRNNNPGNIRSGHFAEGRGSIGSNNGFAIFPTYNIGRDALKSLLTGSIYANLSIYDSITRYAPPSENNTDNYKSRLKSNTGLDLNKKLSSLKNEELESVINAIQINEGYISGSEKIISHEKTKKKED
ncbi:hypothetical protein [Anthocerotibacter panamensis]|uniref:hypothetical protein n=1 Tax=Anthocerotibacter panamensis TaxID=2857077 RepID=UPI001C406ECA|nr:hypothetical protein [Anthocerotibacter panamensis]